MRNNALEIWKENNTILSRYTSKSA